MHNKGFGIHCGTDSAMGGCRCTYRNCSLRTDGKTHMFHYPVFDKVRCHQWLTNAQKLEFLNLKVSQLKNRVVCQHHFKDDSFMNFKKDKLTFDAVPTEDGPYCDSSQLNETKTEQDDSKMFSISLDDIENEYLTIVDKKANFSVKYGDFLTNCDLMDLDSLNSINDSNQIASKGLCELDPIPSVPKVFSSRPVRNVTRSSTRRKRLGNSSKSILNDNINRENTIIQDNSIANHNNTVDNSKQSETQQTEVNQNSMNLMLNVSLVPIEFDGIKSNIQNQQNINQPVDRKLIEEPQPLNENPDRSLLKEKKKIRIISEKRISEPVPVIGKLEPVSPSKILTFPNKKKFLKLNPVTEIPEVPSNSIKESQTNKTDTLKDNLLFSVKGEFIHSNPVTEIPEVPINSVIESQTNEMDTFKDNFIFRNKRKIIHSNTVTEIPEVPMNRNIGGQTYKTDTLKENFVLENSATNIISSIKHNASPEKIISDVINKIPVEVSPNTSLIKNKIPPERVAAIAEKRKFNMKLRDIIEDCLDKLDEPNKTDYNKRKLSHNTRILQSKKQHVGSFLAKNPELPSVQDYTIAYLEARMKKMENNLLSKIEENTQKIVELKQTYAPSCDKKAVHTQTSVSEDVHKRQLYQELSKYLSQEANSLIYEELFINKYTKDVPKCSSSAKRRKCR